MVRTRRCCLKALHAAVFENGGLVGTFASFLDVWDVMDLALASKTLFPYANRGLVEFNLGGFEPEFKVDNADIMCALIRRHPCVSTMVINSWDLLNDKSRNLRDDRVLRTIGDVCRDLREFYVDADYDASMGKGVIKSIDVLARCTQMRTFHSEFVFNIFVEPATFRAWTNLQHLVMDSPLNDACVRAIAESAPGLESLRLDNCAHCEYHGHVTDDGVRALAALENLKTLHLFDSRRITDESITFFLERRGARLAYLELNSTGVTDAVVDAVDAFAQNLISLSVCRTLVHASKLLWYVKRRRLETFFIQGCDGQDIPIERKFRKLGYIPGRGSLFGHYRYRKCGNRD